MNERIVSAPETLAAHEQAAAEITELRRKGIRGHLEERAREGGHSVDVVVDPEEPDGDPAPPRRRIPPFG